jgi:hypothetical protein
MIRVSQLTSDYSIFSEHYRNTVFTVVSDHCPPVAWSVQLSDQIAITLNSLIRIYCYSNTLWDACIKMNGSDLLLILNDENNETIRFRRIPQNEAVIASMRCRDGKEHHRQYIEQHRKDQECNVCIIL